MEKRYRMEPAPRLNPEGRLDGAWLVRDTRLHPWASKPRVVARFAYDGRDKAEAWIAARVKHDLAVAEAQGAARGALALGGGVSRVD